MRDRLVEQRHQGILHQHTRQRHALLLPPGQLRGQPLAQVPDFEKLEKRLDRRIVAPASVGSEQRRHHVVAHHHVRIERVGFEHVGDAAPACRNPVDVAVRNPAMAFVRRLEAGDHPAECRLAGSGRAGHGEHFARPHRKRYRLQGGNRTEALADAQQLQRRAGARRRRTHEIRMRVHAATSRLRPSAPANRWMWLSENAIEISSLARYRDGPGTSATITLPPLRVDAMMTSTSPRGSR